MPENRISAGLSATDQQFVLSAAQTIRPKLPFLIDLSPEDRRKSPVLGNSDPGFVEQALNVATQHTDILPRPFDVDEFRRDVARLTALRPIVTALTPAPRG